MAVADLLIERQSYYRVLILVELNRVLQMAAKVGVSTGNWGDHKAFSQKFPFIGLGIRNPEAAACRE
jgi:hypothetical protein